MPSGQDPYLNANAPSVPAELLNDDAALVQQFARPVFEGLHIAVAGRGETYQGRIDP